MDNFRQIRIVLAGVLVTLFFALLSVGPVGARGDGPVAPVDLLVTRDESGDLLVAVRPNFQNESVILSFESTSREIILTAHPDRSSAETPASPVTKLNITCRDLLCTDSGQYQIRIPLDALASDQIRFELGTGGDHFVVYLPQEGQFADFMLAYDGADRATGLDTTGDLKLASVELAGPLTVSLANHRDQTLTIEQLTASAVTISGSDKADQLFLNGPVTVAEEISITHGGAVTINGPVFAPTGFASTSHSFTLDPGSAIEVTKGAANIWAAGQLVLRESRLSIAGDFTLFAGQTVRIRDGETQPFVARAGDRLTLHGNQVVDILALQHPDSGLISGGDMVLRSGTPVRGDIHYFSGGQFKIEQLDGQPADLFSPYDPIVFANGDVSLGNYTGASLHILAGGGVNLNNIEITGPDTGPNSINPGNTTLFNGVDTVASLAGVTLSNGTSGVINGSITPTLDIRAGIDWNTFQGGAPADQVIPGGVNPIFNGVATSAAISVTGNITISAPAGQVLLTNQYSPNLSLTGDITTGDIDTSTTQPQTNAGSIAIDSRGDITTGNLFTFAEVTGTLVTAGNGGNIGLLAPNGAIVTSGDLSAYSRTPGNNSGPVGNGGFIAAVAANGINIDNGTGAVETFAFSNADGSAGDGGIVGLVTANGDLNIGYINTQTFSSGFGGGSAGNAGDVILEAPGGAITIGSNFPGIFGYSINASVIGNPPGNGGTVTATANSGLNLAADIRTSVSGIDGDAGDITLFTASGDITTGNLIAQAVSNQTPGNGGDVNLEAVGGSITTGDVTAFSDAFVINNDARDGGDILMSASDDINTGSLENYSEARGAQGDAGLGGNIFLEAINGSITGDGNLLAYSLSAINNGDSSLAANGGSITLQVSQNISITGQLDSSSEAQVFAGEGGTAASGGPISVTATNDSIAIGGNITSRASARDDADDGGDISLTAAAGIQVNSGDGIIDASTNSTDGSVGSGGGVTLNTSSGDLDLQQVNSSARNTFGIGPAGSGGSINLTTGNGRIQVAGNFFSALDWSASTIDTAGQAGDITLAATQGISVSAAIRAQGLGTEVDGGDVTLTTAQGDINTTDLLATSINNNSAVGNGGNITVQAFNGGITAGEVSAFADALFIHNDTGDGGNIVLNAFNGDVVSGPLQTYTEARGQFGDTGNAGLVDVTATNGSILIDGDVRADAFSQDNNLRSGNAGDSQGVSLQATQDIAVTGGLNSYARSSRFDGTPTPTGTAGNAGPVTVTGTNISLSYIDARSVATGTIGSGGTVQVTAGQFFRGTSNLFGSASTIDATGLDGSGAITITHGGNGITPFVVGNPATNGISGTLATADATIPPPNSYLYSHFEAPNIWIISVPLPLSISKTASPPTEAAFRGEITYTIVISNPTDVDATGTLVTDTLPAEVDFARWIDQPAGADAASDQITWNGLVPGNEVETFTFVVGHVGNYSDVFTNTAQFVHPDSGSSGAASAQVSITGPPILGISKTATPDTDVSYRGELTYTITLSNGSNFDATGVLFDDTLPGEVDFARWVEQPTGADVAADQITWNGTVSGTETVTFTFVVSHVGNYGDVFTNTADFFHPLSGLAGSASAQVSIAGPPLLSISKAVEPDTEVTYRGEVTYTVVISNDGPSEATGTLFTDTLPISTTFARWQTQPAGASVLTDVIRWNGTVPANETVTFSFVVSHTGDHADVVTNTAKYGHPTSSGTAEATFTVEPRIADLLISKISTRDQVAGLINYTIVVQNFGPDQADGLVVSDTIPAGIGSFTWQCTASGGASCAASGVGDINDALTSFPALSQVVYDVTATLVSTDATIVNVAEMMLPSDLINTAVSNTAIDTNAAVGDVFLPLVLKAPPPPAPPLAPDLIVENLIAHSNAVTVTIKNIGDIPVVDGFWVDVYLNPDTAPTRVNQPWPDVGDQGLVWGVVAPSIGPGESVTLTLSDAAYRPDLSNFVMPLPVGSEVYAQVDSVNLLTDYGGVLESHEISGGAYNNIASTTSIFSETQPTSSAAQPSRAPAPSDGLPPR